MPKLIRNFFKTAATALVLLPLVFAAPLTAAPSWGTMRRDIARELKKGGSSYTRLRRIGRGKVSRAWKDARRIRKFDQQFYLYFTGKYGQKIRQTMGIHYERYRGPYRFTGLSEGTEKELSGPTRKLPPPPPAPGEGRVKKYMIDKLTRGQGCSSGPVSCRIGLKSVDLKNMRFAWNKPRYDAGSYSYSGKLTYLYIRGGTQQAYTCDYKMQLYPGSGKGAKGKKLTGVLDKTNCVKGKEEPVRAGVITPLPPADLVTVVRDELRKDGKEPDLLTFEKPRCRLLFGKSVRCEYRGRMEYPMASPYRKVCKCHYILMKLNAPNISFTKDDARKVFKKPGYFRFRCRRKYIRK